MKYRSSLFVASIVACALPPGLAQSPGQGGAQAPARSSATGQVAAVPTINTGPASGKQATRWEPWSAMRMASATILGWKVGMDSEAIPGLTLGNALQDTDALKLSYIEASSDQRFSEEIPKNVDANLQPGEIQAIKDKLFGLNIQIVSYRIPSLGPDESGGRKLFSFAKDLKIDTIVIEHMPQDLAVVDKLANEYGVNVAICGNPGAVLSVVQQYSKRLGVYGDTAAWLQQGIKPIDILSHAKERLLVLSLGDPTPPSATGHPVALGRGAVNVPQLLREMYRLDIKPSLITIKGTEMTGSMDGLSRALNDFETALRPLMAEKVDDLSRHAIRRGPDLVSAEDKQKIDAALPAAAPAKPRTLRKLLILDFNVAYGGHRSIPAENYALDMMGKRTGAYDAVFDDNLDNLKYPKIKDYDAIYLNNTVGMIFVDPEVREGLLRFVREGGGIGGNHSTSHASMDWPEFHEMIGVTRGVHRLSNEQFWVKIDDPNSPITAPFQGKDFQYADEFFRFVGPLYTRDKLHVLMSMDVQRTDMNQGVPFMPGTLSRPDNDYAVSWIRSYGKGRVFFSILGHNATLFQSPPLAQSFLAGIQFILGDLDADTTPSGHVSAAHNAVSH